jgi:hypothetical protein
VGFSKVLLRCDREENNANDNFAVKLVRNDGNKEHVPIEFSKVFKFFDIARVYFYSQTDYIRQTDIKLTSSNGYKSQKFVSLIDATS